MLNITVDSPDYALLFSSPGALSQYESQLCLQVLLYCSGGILNLDLGCIPLRSFPGSVVTNLVITAKNSELLASLTIPIQALTKNPVAALNRPGATFFSSYGVSGASSLIVQSPPPPASPSPPFPPPVPLPTPPSQPPSSSAASTTTSARHQAPYNRHYCTLCRPNRHRACRASGDQALLLCQGQTSR